MGGAHHQTGSRVAATLPARISHWPVPRDTGVKATAPLSIVSHIFGRFLAHLLNGMDKHE
jgi:hypothetical protein